MNKNLLIGLSPRITTINNTKKIFNNENYIDALKQWGFNSIIIATNNVNIDDVLDLCDGFLITGGIDIHPKYYNEEINGSHEIDEQMDLLDKTIIDYALKHKKPLLGICRGHQAINVFMGGSLIQDIGASHQNTRHDVTTIENNVLAFPKVININSFHHQVINVLADDLVSVATSLDGYNECFVSYKYPIIACQWHPERLMDEESSKIIFKSFKNLFKKNG